MSTFFVEFFCLTVPKNFVAEPFSALFQKISGSQKFMDKRWGGGVSRFSVEDFLSHSSEKIRRGPFVLSLISGIEKFYASEGYVNFFRRIFLSHCSEKNRRGNL